LTKNPRADLLGLPYSELVGDRLSLTQTKIAPISYQLFVFAAGRILKGIANNFSELNNKANHF